MTTQAVTPTSASLVPADSAAESAGSHPLTKSVLVYRAYEEYWNRCEQGEQLDADEYCGQFPDIKESLIKVFHAHAFLEDNPALLTVPDASEVSWPKPGDAFLGYQIRTELGQGAFARVYLATETALGSRQVAIKVAAQYGPDEADILGRINHPNIVPVYSVKRDRDTCLTAICMPYLGSATLCDVLDRLNETPPARAGVLLQVASQLAHPIASGAPSPSASLGNGTYVDAVRRLALQLAYALAYLHSHGICHLDLKPSNVLLTPAGVPMLLDFNLSSDPQAILVRQGGTIPYMSPEQLRAMQSASAESAKSIGAESDLFSLGVILYQLATGKHPFGPIPPRIAPSEMCDQLLERQAKGPIEAWRVNPAVDRRLGRLIHQCLAVDKKDRPRDAASIVSELRREMRPSAHVQRWVARHPKKVIAAGLLMAVMAITGVSAAALRPPVSQRQYDAGVDAYERKHFDQAKAHFTNALQADPKLAVAHFARARTYTQLAEMDKAVWSLALDDFQRAEDLAPDARNWAGMGYCLLKMGQPRAALKYLDKAVTNGFATAATYTDLGYCQLALGDKSGASGSLDKAILFDPNLPAARINRMRLLLDVASNAQSLLQIPSIQPEERKVLEAELADATAVGMGDLQTAMKSGERGREFLYDAACFTCAARPANIEWQADAIRYLSLAIQRGHSPARLAADPALAALRKMPEFDRLVNTPPAVEQEVRSICIPNPVMD